VADLPLPALLPFSTFCAKLVVVPPTSPATDGGVIVPASFFFFSSPRHSSFFVLFGFLLHVFTPPDLE